MIRTAAISLLALAASAAGCAGAQEGPVRQDLAAWGARLEAPGAAEGAEPGSPAEASAEVPGLAGEPEPGVPDEPSPGAPGAGRPEGEAAPEGTLSAYLALALRANPEVRAGFERWKASVHRISRARRLPEPTLGFGYFLQSVETRVGPQQARVSLQQTFPWPTRLTAGADAASAQARAAQEQFEALALSVGQRVATAYWGLWQVRATRATHQQHLEVILGLSESVRARLATGTAQLADLQQIDLSAARLRDSIRGMDEAERVAEANLRAAVGLRGPAPLPTAEAPPVAALPAEAPSGLAEAARAHPRVARLGRLAEASEATARAEGADRLPSFTVGADWIVTGEAAMPDVADSGKDAVVVAAGLRIPLWQGSYADSVAAARADARAWEAERQALLDRVDADLETALSEVRDAARRVDLHQDTLVPQAEVAYESVLGAYTVGRGTVAQTLLAQEALLDLRVELDRARADHARAWASLEEVVGRPVERRSAPLPRDSE